MTFNNETLTPSTSPRQHRIGETKMTVATVRSTTHTVQTVIATSQE